MIGMLKFGTKTRWFNPKRNSFQLGLKRKKSGWFQETIIRDHQMCWVEQKRLWIPIAESLSSKVWAKSWQTVKWPATEHQEWRSIPSELESCHLYRLTTQVRYLTVREWHSFSIWDTHLKEYQKTINKSFQTLEEQQLRWVRQAMLLTQTSLTSKSRALI